MLYPDAPQLLLSRAEVEEKIAQKSATGEWILAVDPGTLRRAFVWRDAQGYIAAVEGHEDLFALEKVIAQEMEGGDFVDARTAALRPHDGLSRSYNVQWIEELTDGVGLVILVGGRQEPNLMTARALRPHIILPVISADEKKKWENVWPRPVTSPTPEVTTEIVREGLRNVLEIMPSAPYIAVPSAVRSIFQNEVGCGETSGCVDAFDFDETFEACLEYTSRFPNINWTFNITASTKVMALGAIEAARIHYDSHPELTRVWYLDSKKSRVVTIVGTQGGVSTEEIFHSTVPEYLATYGRGYSTKSERQNEQQYCEVYRRIATHFGQNYRRAKSISGIMKHENRNCFEIRYDHAGFTSDFEILHDSGLISINRSEGKKVYFSVPHEHFEFLKSDWLEIYTWHCADEARNSDGSRCFDDAQWGVGLPSFFCSADNELDLVATRSGALLIAECKSEGDPFTDERPMRKVKPNGDVQEISKLAGKFYLEKLDSIGNFLGGNYVSRLLVTCSDYPGGSKEESFKDQAQARRVVVVTGRDLGNLTQILEKEAGADPKNKPTFLAL